MKFKKISLIGLGYIGLPTAAMFALQGKHVIGVDINATLVNAVNNANLHTYESGLQDILSLVISNGALRAATKPEPADAFIIAVPTPLTENNKPDISYVYNAAISVAPVLKQGNLIVLESTSPVGTTEKMSNWLADARPDLTFPHTDGDVADIQIAYCPERIMPGNMLEELINNDRIVGGLTKKAASLAEDLYRLIVKAEIHITDARTAELCKLAENSYRDVNIAFANELSIICEKLNIQAKELIQLANRHPRVNILQPGCGVGGHCIPIDPWFIIESVPEEAQLIRTARVVNKAKTNWIVSKIEKIIDQASENIGKQRLLNIACLGITYKADSDDMRESPALEIVQEVSLTCKQHISVVDPFVKSLPETLKGNNVSLSSLDVALTSADIVVVLVGHKKFFSEKIFSCQNLFDFSGYIQR